MQVLDRLVGHAAQLLGLAGPLAQYRNERLRPRQQLGKIRRRPASRHLRLGHRTPLSPPAMAAGDIHERSLAGATDLGEMVDAARNWGSQRAHGIGGAGACRYNRRGFGEDRTAVGVSSMTGFARAAGEAEGISWIWELKSVNGRTLDLRLR